MACSKYGLLTEPTAFDFFHEKLVTAVPFLVAVIALSRYADSPMWLILYLAIIGGHMAHILLKRCPHCAYYKRSGTTLDCLWWRWLPKLREPKPMPPPKYFGIYTLAAILIITAYPIYWLLYDWALLLVYAASWGVLFLSIQTHACARCIDFECKYNGVPQEVRDDYSRQIAQVG